METAASVGPVERLTLRLEQCSGTLPQPSHRTLEIAPATSRLHDSHSRLENADLGTGPPESSESPNDIRELDFRTVCVFHSSHKALLLLPVELGESQNQSPESMRLEP